MSGEFAVARKVHCRRRVAAMSLLVPLQTAATSVLWSRACAPSGRWSATPLDHIGDLCGSSSSGWA